VKIIEAEQARLCNSYRNTKLILLKKTPQYDLINCAELNI
jgi:hypothetical protein